MIIFLVASSNAFLNFKDYAKIHLMNVDESYLNELITKLSAENVFLGKYISHGSYGVVLHSTYINSGASQSIAAKVMLVEDQAECEQTEIISKLTNANAKYILKMYFRKYFGLVSGDSIKHHFCVLGLELGVKSLDEKIFARSFDLSANTQEFIEIVVKLLRGFKYMNFEAKCTHGDIKPPNMILVNNNGILEPRIIDFDLSFQPETLKNKFGKRGLERIIYTENYRPPEMLVFCPDNSCEGYKDEMYANLRMKFYMMYYEFSLECKEDAFALGLSLKDIIDLNKTRLLMSHPIIQKIQDFIIA